MCLAVYHNEPGEQGGDGSERWYGRGEVTRTGSGGVKNYVDSYLTFMLLKRIEAERKARPRPPDGGSP